MGSCICYNEGEDVVCTYTTCQSCSGGQIAKCKDVCTNPNGQRGDINCQFMGMLYNRYVCIDGKWEFVMDYSTERECRGIGEEGGQKECQDGETQCVYDDLLRTYVKNKCIGGVWKYQYDSHEYGDSNCTTTVW